MHLINGSEVSSISLISGREKPEMTLLAVKHDMRSPFPGALVP